MDRSGHDCLGGIEMPKISVMIVTYNREEPLHRCIQSVLEQTMTVDEIVVVDNNSSDNTRDVVRNEYPMVHYLGLEENLGCPSGRNVGFKKCTGDFVYCLDDDGWLEPEAIERAFEILDRDSSVAIVQSRINEMEEGQLVKVRPKYTERMELAHFSGGCSMFRASVLEQVGLYPDDFFRQAEEEDLSLRIIGAGYKIIFEPQSMMYHAAFPIGRCSSLIYRYTLVNSTKIAFRRWPFPYSLGRIAKMLIYSISYSVKNRSFDVAAKVLLTIIGEMRNLRSTRVVIDKEKFNKYKTLKNNPVVSNV